MADSWRDLHTWLHDVGEERIFRLWVYRRMFTPHEEEKKWRDETCYEDSHCRFVRITEVIELGVGDYLIGFIEVETDAVYYYRLSEIRLAYLSSDNVQETDAEDGF